MRRVRAGDGVEVALHDLGGDGEPLLLAHATGFHAHVWAPLAARLAGAFRCWAVDFRGHGRSDSPDYDYPWRDFSLDVLAAVDGAGLAGARPLAVGHSKGAAALLMAEQDRPGTFRALYCYEPIVVPSPTPPGHAPGNPLAVGARKRRAEFPSRDDAYANFAAKPPLNALHPDALRAYVDHGFDDVPGGVRLRCLPEHEARVYAMGFAHDAFARFAEVRCPVTVACGERSDAIAPAVAARQADALPSARTEVLAGLGHFGPLEDPDAVAASIRRAFAAA